MFQATDNDKLSAIMDESPENKEVISKLLEAHRLQISAISHEIRTDARRRGIYDPSSGGAVFL